MPHNEIVECLQPAQYNLTSGHNFKTLKSNNKITFYCFLVNFVDFYFDFRPAADKGV